VGHIVVTLRCECGASLDGEGHAPQTVGVTTTRLLNTARFQGWTRGRGQGWRCPACSQPALEDTPP